VIAEVDRWGGARLPATHRNAARRGVDGRTDGRTDGVEALSVAARRICGGLALAGTG
jgi:hypothetical protein